MPMSIKFKCQMRSLYNQRIWGSGQRQSVHEGRQGRGWRGKPPRKSALPWLSPESDPLNPTPTSVSLPPPAPSQLAGTGPHPLSQHSWWLTCVLHSPCACAHADLPQGPSPPPHRLTHCCQPTRAPPPTLHRCTHVSVAAWKPWPEVPEEPRAPTPGSRSHPSVHPRPQVACRLVGCPCRNREN